MVNNVEIEYLEPKSEFRIGGVKNIAVPSNNKDDIKKMFPGSRPAQSNADMLSQSFNAQPEITPIPSNPVQETQVASNVADPVQITGIPTSGVSNLEGTPVSLDMSTPVVPEVPSIEPVLNVQGVVDNNENVAPVVNNVPEIESIMPTQQVEENIMPNINFSSTIETPTTPNNTGIESGFKVSSAPNIFDNPIPAPVSITEEEINKPLDNQNLFNQPVDEVKTDENNEHNSNSIPDSINDDILLAEIAIEENNIKYYEGLAENSRKKVELLKRQIKKENNDVNLENTASNLFNNNGVLDDEKVLGKTPMPNLRAA